MKILLMIVVVSVLMVRQAGAIPVENLTDQRDEAAVARRRALFNNTPPRPGVRVALLDMKKHNKAFGLGAVDSKVDDYEQSLSVLGDQLKGKGIEVHIYKTDFKGYYLTCEPVISCASTLKRELDRLPAVTFSDGSSLQTQAVTASNYQEGYIRARIERQYPGINLDDKPLHQFIKEEMDAAIDQATANQKLDEKAFGHAIDQYRSAGLDQVDPRYRRLVVALDTLLETPFMNANNLDLEMTRALREPGMAIGQGRQLTTAQSGDDLFVVIKKADEVSAVVGVDARGLGNTNMQTRYQEYVKVGGKLQSMDDVLSLSHRAIVAADQQMEDSFGLFQDLLAAEFKTNPNLSVELALEKVNNSYRRARRSGFAIMGARIGVASTCGRDQKCIMDQVTVIHNNLKKMERAGLDDQLGTSCLSSFYWVHKYGL